MEIILFTLGHMFVVKIKLEKNWGAWTIQYSTVLIIQNINLKGILRWSGRTYPGNTWSWKTGVTQPSLQRVEKPWAGHFPFGLLLWVLMSSPKFLIVCKPGARNIDGRMEKGSLLSPETVVWDGFLPLTRVSQTGFLMAWASATV